MADSNSYPMISEKNWWTIREKFKASLPAIATPNYVKTLLTLVVIVLQIVMLLLRCVELGY